MMALISYAHSACGAKKNQATQTKFFFHCQFTATLLQWVGFIYMF